jgi:hypothetical protein
VSDVGERYEHQSAGGQVGVEQTRKEVCRIGDVLEHVGAAQRLGGGRGGGQAAVQQLAKLGLIAGGAGVRQTAGVAIEAEEPDRLVAQEGGEGA